MTASSSTKGPELETGERLYPTLFSPWRLRGHEVKNRIVFPLLPSRSEYARIGEWLGAQAAKSAAEIRTSTDVTGREPGRPARGAPAGPAIVATGARVAKDGFQGWTGGSLPGVTEASVVGWDDVVEGRAQPSGDVLVLDDVCDAVAPVALAQAGTRVKLVTRWPMVGMDTILDVYLEWILPKVYEAGVEMVCDHFVKAIRARETVLSNVHAPGREQIVSSDHIVMVTARRSENGLVPLLADRGVRTRAPGSRPPGPGRRRRMTTTATTTATTTTESKRTNR